MKVKMVSTLVASAVFAGLLVTAPGQAAIRVYVPVPPPPAIVETVPASPSPRHIWVGGYHRWNGRAYVWVPGHYEVPRRHYYRAWVPGHWTHNRHGWYWADGHWSR